MAKRTESDDLISQRIYKNRKEAEERAGVERLKYPIPRLSGQEVRSIVCEIENFVVEEFSKDNTLDHVSLSACQFRKDGETVHKVFRASRTYLTWLLDYNILIGQNVSDPKYQQFACEWIKKETVHFLDIILTTWNNLHGTYVMSWNDESPFEISIKKIE